MSDYTPSKPTRVRMNPSRRTCEEIIRRILSTENLENGRNCHFKTAMDFMTYFESLYPSGPGLTKQVQRAIRSMNLAKDENGYFLLGKTKEDFAIEQEISSLLKKGDASLAALSSFETVLLRISKSKRAYLAGLLADTGNLGGLFITTVETYDGLLFLTHDAAVLKEALARLGAETDETDEPPQ